MWTKLRPFTLLCLVASAAVAALSTQGCSSKDATASCDEEQINTFKELIVVDEDVLADGRAKNASAGPWSFRNAVEQMVPQGSDPSMFVQGWLDTWVTQTEVNSFPLDRPQESRAAKMNSKILCPWYQATPANACDATCSTCKANVLDLAKAPFRLIAIANRIDQREQVIGEASGESRLVFALTNGAGDDAASAPLAMTVIFEYALPTTRTPQQWAEAWHALGKFGDTGEGYRAALEGVTSSFVARGSNPSGVNGSALGHIRTNESYLDWIWQQREFGLGSDGMIALFPTRNTPGEALNGSDQLTQWIKDNRAAVLANRYEIPASMRSGSSDALQYQWSLPGLDLEARNAFAQGTCNGCHTTEHTSIDAAFHVSPFRKGTDKLSPFLYDPNGGSSDLTFRASSMQRALCGN